MGKPTILKGSEENRNGRVESREALPRWRELRFSLCPGNMADQEQKTGPVPSEVPGSAQNAEGSLGKQERGEPWKQRGRAECHLEKQDKQMELRFSGCGKGRVC